MIAVDTEFYVTNSTRVFIQPGYGVGNEFGQTGLNGPPIYPFGTLGARVKYVFPNTEYYVQGAVTDGVPSHPRFQHGTRLQLNDGDGTFNLVEVGYTPSPTPSGAGTSNEGADNTSPPQNYMHKTAFGLWWYTSKFDDLQDLDSDDQPIRRKSRGAYFISEHPLYLEQGDASQGLTGFFRMGYAGKDLYQSDWSASAGLVYVGLLPGRDEDVAGVGVTVNHASSKFQSMEGASSRETQVELTYKAQVNGGFFLQPNIQYIHHPNMNQDADDVWIVGLRTELHF